MGKGENFRLNLLSVHKPAQQQEARQINFSMVQEAEESEESPYMKLPSPLKPVLHSLVPYKPLVAPKLKTRNTGQNQRIQVQKQ